jgi:autotransporter-associated beta strand protein
LHSGPTTVAGSLLVAGAANALSPNSDVNITGGTLDASGFAQTIKSLSMDALATLNLSLGALLTSSGPVNLSGTLNLANVTGAGELISYNSASGTFGTVNGLPGSYQLVYNPTELDVINLAATTSTTYALSASAAATLLHVGDSTTVAATITNAGTGTADLLNYAGLKLTASSGSLSGGGLPKDGGPLAQGASDSGSLMFLGSTPGAITLTPRASGGTNATLLTPASSSSVTSTTISVFSGSGTWTSSSGSLWAGHGNWIDINGVSGAPGTFAGYDDVDAAVLGGTGSVTTISLSGANPSLKSLSLGGANYTLTGGTLHLNSDSGVATLSAPSGIETLESQLSLSLDSSADFAPAFGASITIAGPITGSGGIHLVDAGTLTLSGSNNYGGETIVAAGTLVIADAAALVDGSSLSVGSAAAFSALQPAAGPLGAGTFAPVPEPGTTVLFVTAALGVAVYRGMRRRAIKGCAT